MGGALHVAEETSSVAISGSEFVKCTAGNDGGAIGAAGKISLTGGRFIGNTAEEGSGGAVSVSWGAWLRK